MRYGESEHEVSFGLAPRNEDLQPSDLETPEPFPLQDWDPRENWDQYVKTWYPGHMYPEMFLTSEVTCFRKHSWPVDVIALFSPRLPHVAHDKTLFEEHFSKHAVQFLFY